MLGYETKRPLSGFQSRWNSVEEDTSVNENFDPSINDYQNYLKEENLEESKYLAPLEEFKRGKIDIDKTTYENYLQHLIDKKILQGNRELYSHIVETLDCFVFNNLIHVNKKKEYQKVLKEVLYSSNKEYEINDVNNKYTKIDYSMYREGIDCREVYNNQLLNELHARGGELYLNTNNKFYFKLSHSDKLDEYPKRTVEVLLTRAFGFKVEITDDVLEYKDIDMNDFIFKSSSYDVNDVKLLGDSNEKN